MTDKEKSILEKIEKALARAKSTTFEGEREACLRMVEKLKKQYFNDNVDTSQFTQAVKINNQTFDIAHLREIFVKTFFPWFSSDFNYSEQIPFSLKLYSKDYILQRLNELENENLIEYFNSYLKNLHHNVLFEGLNWYYFLPLDKDMIELLMERSYEVVKPTEYEGCIPMNGSNRLSPVENCLRFFKEKRDDFYERLNHGWLDDVVLQLCNPKFLPAPVEN